MEVILYGFKKCARCGCFFMSNNDVCCNCESKDMFDIAKLNSIMEDNINFNSIQELSNESRNYYKQFEQIYKK